MATNKKTINSPVDSPQVISQSGQLSSQPIAVTKLPKPKRKSPLPQANPNPPSSFDAVIEENPGIQAQVRAKMIEMKVDPEKTSFKEFFVMYMWSLLLGSVIKEKELAARILGRGYIGEKEDDEGVKPLVIEDYKEGVGTLLGPSKKI